MKKILLLIASLFSLTLAAKNQRKYLDIGYSSICCGPPSSEPVMEVLKKFQQKNQLSTFEVLIERWGPEGEYNLYIGIDELTFEQKEELKIALANEVDQQNKMRNDSRDGEVKIYDEGQISKKRKKNIQKYK